VYERVTKLWCFFLGIRDRNDFFPKASVQYLSL